MPKLEFDLESFYLALDDQRHSQRLTWKQVAAQSQVSASTLTLRSISGCRVGLAKDSPKNSGYKTMNQPIYREFTLQRTSVKAAGEFIQALILSKGQIVSMFSLSNGFKHEKITYFSSFYKLRFSDQSSLEKFEALGFETTEPEKVVGQNQQNSGNESTSVN